jgi:hypothetical protein
VVFSPEREDPGNATVARRDIPKVVDGLTWRLRNSLAPFTAPSSPERFRFHLPTLRR